MATELVVTVKDRRLIPASQIDWETLDKMREDIPMACKLWQPRSLPHNRWYRALLTVVAEGNGMPHEALHEILKLKAGLFHINLGAGTPMVILHSTAFEAMDETSFKRFTEFALETILREYVSGITRADLIRKVNEMANIEFKSLHKVKHEPQAQGNTVEGQTGGGADQDRGDTARGRQADDGTPDHQPVPMAPLSHQS